MQISASRQNALIKLSVDAAMAVLKAGLPEFSTQPMKNLREEIEMHLADTIESHIAGLTEDEYVPPSKMKPFGVTK